MSKLSFPTYVGEAGNCVANLLGMLCVKYYRNRLSFVETTKMVTFLDHGVHV